MLSYLPATLQVKGGDVMGAYDAILAEDHCLPWTTEEFLALGELPAWPRVELIDGSLYVSPNAGLPHQQACGELLWLLRQAATGLPLTVYSPANVNVSPSSFVIPDVVVCRSGLLTLAADAEDVVLVVEVESPSTRRYDRLTKADVYAKAGIVHYWRVELPVPGDPVVCRYELEVDAYRLVEEVPAGRTLTVTEPFAVQFDPACLNGGGDVPG